MATWRVCCTASVLGDDGITWSKQVPTFSLDGDLLGIVDEEHAKVIAREIVNPFGVRIEVNVSVAET